MLNIEKIINILYSYKFPVSSEKELQEAIYFVFKENNFDVKKEYYLNNSSIVDFYTDGIAIEVKIKGSAKSIYRQCERYCLLDNVKSLILVSSKAMGFPEEINGKPCYYVNISNNFL